jgi:hypothetical protein
VGYHAVPRRRGQCAHHHSLSPDCNPELVMAKCACTARPDRRRGADSGRAADGSDDGQLAVASLARNGARRLDRAYPRKVPQICPRLTSPATARARRASATYLACRPRVQIRRSRSAREIHISAASAIPNRAPDTAIRALVAVCPTIQRPRQADEVRRLDCATVTMEDRNRPT